MKLAIVGSRLLPPKLIPAVLDAIAEAVRYHEPDEIVSGGAVGVDTLAYAFARGAKIKCEPIEPEVFSWEDRDGKPGYRSRNVAIANRCDALLCIRAGSSKTYGSGWTADFAESQGKSVQRVMLTKERAPR